MFANLEKFGLYKVPRLGGLQQKLYANSVFAYGLAQDGQGRLLAGNSNQLIHYKPTANTYSILSVPNGATIWTLTPFRFDQWIAGTSKGLMLVDAQKRQVNSFTHYNQFTELAQGHILHIAPDRRGTLWICATTGLYTLDRTKGVTARYWSDGQNGFHLPADSYQHFYQDKQGTYWLATANAGLIRWDRKQNQYRQYRRTEGLSNDNIYAIYSDRRGHLWMSSDYGIMRFDPVSQTTQTYSVQDGITHNEFNRIAHFQDRDGQIYFGGLNGITSFDPQDFETEKQPTSLLMRVVSFRQFDNGLNQLVDKTAELVQSSTISIEPGDQMAVLNIALLNFVDAEKNVYAYRFADLTNEWTQQTESSLRLGNLPYGTHQLLIKGQAANGQ